MIIRNTLNTLNKNDKDYWQTVWKRQQFLDMFWERMYKDGSMSWLELFAYLESGDFKKDVIQDIYITIEANGEHTFE